MHLHTIYTCVQGCHCVTLFRQHPRPKHNNTGVPVYGYYRPQRNRRWSGPVMTTSKLLSYRENSCHNSQAPTSSAPRQSLTHSSPALFSLKRVVTSRASSLVFSAAMMIISSRGQANLSYLYYGSLSLSLLAVTQFRSHPTFFLFP